MKRLTRTLAPLAALIVIAISSSVQAGGCSDCDGCSNVKKVCRKVCTFEEVEVKCWGCKCEDFCLPGDPDIKQERPCDSCSCDSGSCDGGCEASCGCDSGLVHSHKGHNGLFGTKLFATPCHRESSCASVHTKKKLGYYVIKKKVPVVKWEIVELCDGCCDSGVCCDPGDVAPGDIIHGDHNGVPVPADDVPPAPPEPSAKKFATKIQMVKGTLDSGVKKSSDSLRSAFRVWNK